MTKKPIRIVNRLNAYCHIDKHDECPAANELNVVGTRVIFVCSCECHKESRK